MIDCIIMRTIASGLLVVVLVAACGGEDDENVSTGSGALGTYRDGCEAAACGTQPVPVHLCVGGYATSVCTNARGTCGWQTDCLAEPPPGYDGTIGIGSCEVGACGALPDADEKDCVYGFLGEPQCERYDRQPCAWARRCRPRPCGETGTCNTLDRSKLGDACDLTTPCPAGYSCASISVNVGEQVPPTCVQQLSCPLTCASGSSCVTMESYPAQIACARD